MQANTSAFPAVVFFSETDTVDGSFVAVNVFLSESFSIR